MISHLLAPFVASPPPPPRNKKLQHLVAQSDQHHPAPHTPASFAPSGDLTGVPAMVPPSSSSFFASSLTPPIRSAFSTGSIRNADCRGDSFACTTVKHCKICYLLMGMLLLPCSINFIHSQNFLHRVHVERRGDSCSHPGRPAQYACLHSSQKLQTSSIRCCEGAMHAGGVGTPHAEPAQDVPPHTPHA